MTSAPFEADISMIELNQKDLSLVEEDDLRKILDLPLAEPKQLTSAVLKDIEYKNAAGIASKINDSCCSAELSLFQSETSDVIDDLKNLSHVDRDYSYQNTKQLYGPSDK